MSQGSPPSRTPACATTENLPSAKVLLVEDQAVIALDLQRVLREAGYRVVGHASSIDEVENLIARGSIDCAILNLNLNGQVAFDVADLLALTGIPFLFLTGYGRDGLPERHAARPIVEKPYSNGQLLAAIQQANAGRTREEGIFYSPAPAHFSWPRIMPQL